MLLLPAPLVKFADYLVETTSPPFKTLTRQEAIRNVLSQLMVRMKFPVDGQFASAKQRAKPAK